MRQYRSLSVPKRSKQSLVYLHLEKKAKILFERGGGEGVGKKQFGVPGSNSKSLSVLGKSKCKSYFIFQYKASLITTLTNLIGHVKTWIETTKSKKWHDHSSESVDSRIYFVLPPPSLVDLYFYGPRAHVLFFYIVTCYITTYSL